MKDKLIPSPPEKPTAYQCCGNGCVPCIFDYYYAALEKWNELHAKAFHEQQGYQQKDPTA